LNIGIDLDEVSDDEASEPHEKDRKYLPYPVLGALPPDVIFGDHEARNAMMNLMTADEKIEELQQIIDTREHSETPNGKENDQYEVVRQLENKLTEVMQVNDRLVDELHDKNYMDPGVKTKLERDFLQTEQQLEAKIANVMNKMGSGMQNVRLIQDIVGQSMAQFKNKIAVDIENESFRPEMRTSRDLKRSLSSSEGLSTPKSIQGTYSSTFDSQFAASKSRGFDNMVSSSSKLATKPVNRKSAKHFYKPKPKSSKNSTSQKHLNTVKKAKTNSKYLNFIDSSKGKNQNENIKVVPLNGYTPDIIKNTLQRKYN
jgi:hypothetical protein